jgi:hypothetical protein
MGSPHHSTPESRVGPLFTPLGRASPTGIGDRQAGGRGTVPVWKPTRERTASGLPAKNHRETDDQSEELLPTGGLLPAPARRFGITDSQQWIDLCG